MPEADIIKHFPTLKELYLDYEISGKNFIYILDAVRQSNIRKMLFHVVWNNTEHVCEIEDPGLEWLQINVCETTPTGVTALTDAIAEWSSLHKLSFKYYYENCSNREEQKLIETISSKFSIDSVRVSVGEPYIHRFIPNPLMSAIELHAGVGKLVYAS